MTSALRRWYARTTARHSSGSSCSESAVEPTRSQNMTVNWRRSAPRTSRTESRVWGLVSGGWRGVPHSAQNLACGGFSTSQLGQRCLSEPPHSMQNLAPSRFSVPQAAQRIQLPLYPLCPWWGKRAWPSRECHTADQTACDLFTVLLHH